MVVLKTKLITFVEINRARDNACNDSGSLIRSVKLYLLVVSVCQVEYLTNLTHTCMSLSLIVYLITP